MSSLVCYKYALLLVYKVDITGVSSHMLTFFIMVSNKVFYCTQLTHMNNIGIRC